MDEKHIMISLGDDKAKQISEVIGNKSCNKILDILAEDEATETDISKKLKMPLNTVGYNIKKLIKSGLIEKSSHWWSVKGKKMPTYRVSNRKIIISPKKSMVKVFAWVVGLTGLTALTIRQLMGVGTESAVAPSLMASHGPVLLNDVARGVSESLAVLVEPSSSYSFWASISPWSWFLIGAWFAVALFFVITLYNERRRN